MDLLRNFKTFANFITVLQNHINVLFHCIEITEIGVEVIKETVSFRQNVLANWCDYMIVGNSLATDVISDMLKFCILNQLEIMWLYLETIIHVANEVHKPLISMAKCIRNLVKDDILRRSLLHLDRYLTTTRTSST